MSRLVLTLLLLVVSGCRCGEKGSTRAGDKPPVVVVDPDEANRPKPVDEVEPNNRRKEAQLLPTDREVQGQLSAADASAKAKRGDVDWYRLETGEASQVATVTLSGVPGGDLTLEAFDGQGKRLVNVNNTREGGGETLVNLAGEAGSVYYLRVRAWKGKVGEGHYRLGYRTRSREEGEEVEPNWKAPLASSLALEEEATGYLGWHTDTDWYRVELGEVPAGSRLRLEFDGVDDVRAGVSLREKGGKVIQERWGGSGAPVVLPNLKIPASTEVFAVVRCRYHYNVETRYSLRVLSVVPSGPTEAEPNDLPQLATPLAVGVTTAGLLADSNDRDLFHLHVVSPRMVQIKAVPPLGVDLTLALLDREGKVLKEVNTGKNRVPELLAAIRVQPPGALFRLKAVRGAASAVTPYHIQARFLPEGPWEQEPNDTPARATPWGGAVPTMRGFLHPTEDVDYYRVVARTAVTMVARPPAGVDLRLDLLGTEGGSVASSSTKGVGEARLQAPAAQSGLYLLKVVMTGSLKKTKVEPYVLNQTSSEEQP